MEALITKLRQLACALPRPGCAWESPSRIEPPATLGQVDEFERIVGFRFPPDLRAFLLNTRAIVAMSMHSGYWIGSPALPDGINSRTTPYDIAKLQLACVGTSGNG